MQRIFVLSLVFALAACGGGGGTDTPGAPGAGNGTPPGLPGGGGGNLTPNPGPQVALLVVSGHAFGVAPTYLDTTAGPFLTQALTNAGFTVETTYYEDGGGAAIGYVALLERLRFIRDNWIENRSNPTQIILVAHSHGGPWSHGATRDVPDAPVRLQVDLDTSSNGFALVHTAGEVNQLGGTPEEAYNIPLNVTCPVSNHPSQAGFSYDLEDVVFPSVEKHLEVRSGDIVLNPLNIEEYDERWNARLDATTTDLACHFSGTNHSEVHAPLGTTMPFVRDWILREL